MQLNLLYNKDENCEACMSSSKFKTIKNRTTFIGELIHIDVCGPIKPITNNGEKYFQVLIDDFPHFTIVKLLKTKNEAQNNVIDFVKLIKIQHGRKTKKNKMW